MTFIIDTNTPAAILGSSGMTLLYHGSDDDNYIQITLPFAFPFYGTNRTVFVGTNSYITFGAGSKAYYSFSASSPGKALLVGAADNSYQRIYQFDAPSGHSTRIRYEGTANSYGTEGSPNIVWEATFYDDGKIQLVVGTHNRLSGASFISDGTTSTSYTLAQNQSYVFETSPSGATVYTGASVTEGGQSFSLVATGGAVFGGSAGVSFDSGSSIFSIVSQGGAVFGGSAGVSYFIPSTEIASALPWIGMENKSPNVCKITSSGEWRDGWFYNVAPATCLQSPDLTNNAPIDVVSWSITGHTGESGLEWWQQCMTLFLRHI